MKMTSEWSGLATFGDLDEAAMLNAQAIQESQDMGKVELSVSASKAQLPVWMLWSETSGPNNEVRDYWKKQNDSAKERFSNAEADEIYFPSSVYKKSSVNEEKISQVRITNSFSGGITEELFQAVWQFISTARRCAIT